MLHYKHPHMHIYLIRQGIVKSGILIYSLNSSLWGTWGKSYAEESRYNNNENCKTCSFFFSPTHISESVLMLLIVSSYFERLPKPTCLTFNDNMRKMK